MATRGMTVFTHQGTDYSLNDPNIANEFSASKKYLAGDYVNYQGDLYKFSVDHAAGSWNASHAVKVLLGRDVSSVVKNGAENIIDSYTKEDKDAVGVQYTWSGSSCVIYGTASATSNDRIVNSLDNMPYGIEAGKTYYLKYHSEKVRLRMYGAIGGVQEETQFVDTLDDQVITIPAEYTGLNIRLYIKSGTAVDETVTVGLYRAFPNIDLTEYAHDDMGYPYAFHKVNDIAETEKYDVTYSIQDSVATFSGTASSTLNVNLDGDTDKIPSWLKAKTKYYFTLNKVNGAGIKFVLTAYDSNSTAIPEMDRVYEDDGEFYFDNLTGVAGVIIRYRVSNGSQVNGKISLKIMEGVPTVRQIADMATGSVTKLRILQNNMGHMNMGNSLSSDVHFLTTENYEDVMKNYKKLFSDHLPDVFGAEEFEPSRDIYTTGGTPSVYTTVDMVANLFSRVFPNIRYQAGSSKNAILSKYPLLDYASKTIDFEYIYNGETKSSSINGCYAHVMIDGKNVCFFVSAMVSGPNAQSMAARRVAYQKLIDFLAREEYAFIVCDANTEGDSTATTIDKSVEEGNAIYDEIMKPGGWESAMGSYFDWETTYRSPRSLGVISAIDNIYYKDNGKVVLSGLHVLGDLYDDLASDHIPIVADFTLL